MEVSQEYTEQVKKHLTDFPILVEYFNREWLDKNILTPKRTYKIHFLFWILLDENHCKNLMSYFSILANKLTNFKSLINKIKTNPDRYNFLAITTEIEVLAFYKSLENEQFKVEYEPKIENQTRKCDIRITFEGKPIFLEILRIVDDEIEMNFEEIRNSIREKIDDLQNNKYLISFGIRENFNKEHIDSFVTFVKDLISKKQIIPKERYDFKINEVEIGDVHFSENTSDTKGHVVGFHGPVRVYNDAVRLKNKILDKVKQMPKGEAGIVITNLSHLGTDFVDIEDAFFGQSAVSFSIGGDNSQWVRLQNGVIHSEDGKYISLVVGFTDYNYKNRKKYFNLNSINPLKTEISNIL